MSHQPGYPLPAHILPRLTPAYKPFTILEDAHERKVYARRLYGFEASVAFMSETGVGFSTYTGGLSVRIICAQPGAPALERTSLLSALRRSWAKTRFLAPSIACRAFGIASSENFGGETTNVAHYCVYGVPSGQADVEQWVDETLKLHPVVGEDLHTMEKKLTTDYWDAADGRFVVELHAAQGYGEWFFFLHGPHFACDARYSFSILDSLLHFLVQDLKDTSRAVRSLNDLRWGTEGQRLPPASAFAMQTEGHAVDIETKQVTPTTPSPEQPVLFLRRCPPQQVVAQLTSDTPGTYPNIHSTISLSPEQTRAFRRACKAHGRTVTTVIDAILVLAELEAVMRRGVESLRKAKGDGGALQEWQETKDLYDQATFLPVPLKFVDMRHALASDYAALLSEQSTPPFVLHTVTHMHPMDSLRNAVVVQDTPQGVKLLIDSSERVFWNGVVKDSATLWEDPKPSPVAFVNIQAEISRGLPPPPDANQFLLPALVMSSTGDFDRMGAPLDPGAPTKSLTGYGVLGRWNPSVLGPLEQQFGQSRNAAHDSVHVEIDARVIELTVAVRAHKWPLVVAEYFQYDGRLVLHLFSSSGWHQQDDIDGWALAVRSWIDRVTADESI